MQNLIKTLFKVIAFILSLGIAMSQVSYDNAMSNISSYLPSSITPDILKQPFVDVYVFYTCLTLLVLLLSFTLFLRMRKNKNISPVLILTGNEKPFIKEENFKIYSLQKTMFVAVMNNTKKFISNCKLEILFKNEENLDISVMLEEGFTLNSKEKKDITACYYMENNPDAKSTVNPATCINILPKFTGFYCHEYMLPAQRKNIVTFRLTYLEGEPVEKKCYLWVSNGKLTIEERK